jgi:hypothetical protein
MFALLTNLFYMPRPWKLALAALVAAVVLAGVRSRRGRFDAGAIGLSVAILAVAGVALLATRVAYTSYLKSLGRNLPKVELLVPAPDAVLGDTISLRAHATDAPGELGPIAAVRRVEFWLYHPSFVEQHAGNHESKVFLGQVKGPTPDDAYAISWTCSNPLTPPRDGDHSGGDGTRTYNLPDDGRPYSVQAHALDDEFLAHPKSPGKSERVPIRFTPCK